MTKKIQSVSKNIRQKFDDIKMVNPDGQEYWSARDLMKTLGYKTWENFEKVINKTIASIINTNNKPIDHILEVTKMVSIGSGAEREVSDFWLTKYACFVIAQNSNPAKKAVAEAQAYFAIQTHKQELFEQLSPDGRRLIIREEVIDHNKKLGEVAKKAGVKNYGTFHDEGYRGLYGMRYKDIIKYKSLGRDKLLDRAGETELAANLFRITQTHDQINHRLEGGERVGGEVAVKTHYVVGSKVRDAIKKIGGTMPEELKLEPHIKELDNKYKEDRGITMKSTSEKPVKLKGSFDENVKKIAKSRLKNE